MQHVRRRLPTSILSALVGLAVCAGLVLSGLPSGAQHGSRSSALRDRLLRAPVRVGDVSDYQGAGTWVDIYDESWQNPAAAVRAMHARGYRTLYLETSNYGRDSAFAYRAKTEQFLDAAHRWGIRTVAWYLPGFRNVEMDYKRSIAAIKLVTDDGNRFDSFALDIEASIVRDPDKRSDRMLRLSERIRAFADGYASAGPMYPLGAIIPSPRGIKYATGYWPRFPYRELMSIYDVIVPMSYFTWKVQGAAGVHWYMTQCFKILRRSSGVPDFPVHMIGGIADETSESETRAYVRTLREFGGVGGSYYTFPLTRGSHHALLQRLPVNPRQTPAMPVGLGYDAPLGNIPGRDETHPKEVFFTTDQKRGPWLLDYDAFDIQQDEVSIFVNWRRVATIAPGTPGAWTGERTRRIAGKFLRDGKRNVVQFVAAGSDPTWSVWGVRDVGLRKDT
ncbi:MAG: hypothetical protein WEA10_07170 [Actinomycetota bacterium]